MEPTMLTGDLDRSCDAAPAVVYGIVADLARLPDWWLWNHPHPRLEPDRYEITDLTGTGTAAAEGVSVEIHATGGAATIRGKRHTWEPRTCRYTCTQSVRNEQITLTIAPGPDDANNHVRELQIVITPEASGSRITLRRISETNARGLRRALAKQAHQRGWGLERPIKRLAALAEGAPAPPT